MCCVTHVCISCMYGMYVCMAVCYVCINAFVIIICSRLCYTCVCFYVWRYFWALCYVTYAMFGNVHLFNDFTKVTYYMYVLWMYVRNACLYVMYICMVCVRFSVYVYVMYVCQAFVKYVIECVNVMVGMYVWCVMYARYVACAFVLRRCVYDACMYARLGVVRYSCYVCIYVSMYFMYVRMYALYVFMYVCAWYVVLCYACVYVMYVSMICMCGPFFMYVLCMLCRYDVLRV